MSGDIGGHEGKFREDRKTLKASLAALEQVPREVVESPSAEIFMIWPDRGMVNQTRVGDSPASGRRLNYTTTEVTSKPAFR